MKLARCGHSECETCHTCVRCECTCWKCECGRRYLAHRIAAVIHNVCRRCRKCCQCRNSPRYLSDEQLNTLVLHTPGGPALLTQLPRTLGVELEIGKWGTLPTASNGTAVSRTPGLAYSASHDWSVKPSELELVTTPMRGDAAVRGMLELSRATLAGGCEANESCALHVHVGGRDLSYFDLRRLLTVYNTIEPELYARFVAPHRRSLPSIHYCQMMSVPHTAVGCERCERYDRQYPNQRRVPEPLETTLDRMWAGRTTEDLKVCLLRMLYDIENPENFPTLVSTRKGGHYEFCRYFGLNLHSWMHRHTVEFRMKEATMDPWELVFWPLWCGWFVHAVTRMPDREAHTAWTVRSVTERWMPGYFREWLGRHGV